MVAWSEAAWLSQRRRAVVIGAATAAYLLKRRSNERSRRLFRTPSASIADYVAWGLGMKVEGRDGNIHRIRMNWPVRVASLSDSNFKRRYKVSKARFAEIANNIRSLVEAENHHQARRSSGSSVSAEIKLSAFLRYLAGGHYLDIVDMHGISESTFYQLLTDVPRAINEVYSDEIAFPMEDPQKLEELSQGFYQRSGQTMAGIVGALDGVVLLISKPSLLDVPNPSDHWNRKGHYAVVYQVLVDSKMKIQWFCCKSTGNTNDSVAFDTSSLKRLLDSSPLPYPFFIIGDEAYKSSGHVATPYPGCDLDQEKDAFNFYHSRTRMTVEQAFGLFKNTWRMFSRPSQLALDHFQEVTRAAFRLHNIVIDDKAIEGN
eukprot:scaffold29253_cov31-Prasinocladus_malaysianus.AAC.2